MTVYYDPTEARPGTKNSPNLMKESHPLPNLERLTGADFFIDPTEDIISFDITMPPGAGIFAQRLKRGMLVQRKHEGDMLQSIPRLRDILIRMRDTESMCWLLVVGKFSSTLSGHVAISTEKGYFPTKWGWSSFQGATDAWQIRGGYVHACEDMFEAHNWIMEWDRKIKGIDIERSNVIVRRPTAPEGKSMMHPKPWIVTLESFPGVGPANADAISDYCDNLYSALMWMSDETIGGVSGIGKRTKEMWRRYMGLDGDKVLVSVPRDWRKYKDEEDSE